MHLLSKIYHILLYIPLQKMAGPLELGITYRGKLFKISKILIFLFTTSGPIEKKRLKILISFV